MAERTTPSLAFAEYVSPDPDNSVQVWLARRQVIEASKRVYPTFLKKLSTDVFPIYRRLAKAGKLAKGRINFEKALWGKFMLHARTAGHLLFSGGSSPAPTCSLRRERDRTGSGARRLTSLVTARSGEDDDVDRVA
jgi:hypothetical protein